MEFYFKNSPLVGKWNGGGGGSKEGLGETGGSPEVGCWAGEGHGSGGGGGRWLLLSWRELGGDRGDILEGGETRAGLAGRW